MMNSAALLLRLPIMYKTLKNVGILYAVSFDRADRPRKPLSPMLQVWYTIYMYCYVQCNSIMHLCWLSIRCLLVLKWGH